jgi:hypothetical protein
MSRALRSIGAATRRVFESSDVAKKPVDQHSAHLSLERNAPIPRRVEHPSEGKVIAIPQVNGLHHRYRRAA